MDYIFPPKFINHIENKNSIKYRKIIEKYKYCFKELWKDGGI